VAKAGELSVGAFIFSGQEVGQILTAAATQCVRQWLEEEISWPIRQTFNSLDRQIDRELRSKLEDLATELGFDLDLRTLLESREVDTEVSGQISYTDQLVKAIGLAVLGAGGMIAADIFLTGGIGSLATAVYGLIAGVGAFTWLKTRIINRVRDRVSDPLRMLAEGIVQRLRNQIHEESGKLKQTVADTIESVASNVERSLNDLLAEKQRTEREAEETRDTLLRHRQQLQCARTQLEQLRGELETEASSGQ
jgi:hypothetical protein